MKKKKKKNYKGSCETTFEKGFANHQKSFNNGQYKTETVLSKEVLNLKLRNSNREIVCKIVRRYASVNRGILRCNLCLNEKL